MRQTKGFTLIELMLAMSFVAVLLVAIAMLTIQISNIYTRGITLKQVNETGLEVSNDLQRSIQGGEIFALSDENNDHYVQFEGGKSGRLCLGGYSYAWNYGASIVQAQAQGSVNTLPNHYEGATNTTPIRFVKASDPGKKLCKKDIDTSTYPNLKDDDSTTELLASGDRDLALHRFDISGNEQGGLYAITLTIGTNDQALLNSVGQCRPPSEIPGQESYCSVNTFDIVARAGTKEGTTQ